MDTDRRRTLRAAAHPLVLGAAALIFVNDLGLRVVSPGWLTGKLSDAGFLVVAPVFAAALLAAAGLSGRLARVAGLVGTAAVYVTLQLWPPLGALFRATHVADAEDLLVLPALAGAVLAWRRARAGRAAAGRAAGALALPFLAGSLVATSTGGGTLDDASWPCGRGMLWDPADPLYLQFGTGSSAPIRDSDAFLRGLRLVDAEGREVPLVAAPAADWYGTLVCAREGLRGDTDYAWTIGPWAEVSTNTMPWEHSGMPTVRFRTLPGEGVSVANLEGCADLAGTLDTGAEDQHCGIGDWDTGGWFDTGDGRDPGPHTGDTGDTDTAAAAR